AGREVVRQLALATADVEHALTLIDAVDEEVVVAGQPVLRMHALVVVDRAEVDPVIRIVVELQQLPHRALAIGLCSDRPEPEAEERAPHRVREENPERTQRHPPSEPPRDAPRGPGPGARARYPSS